MNTAAAINFSHKKGWKKYFTWSFFIWSFLKLKSFFYPVPLFPKVFLRLLSCLKKQIAFLFFLSFPVGSRQERNPDKTSLTMFLIELIFPNQNNSYFKGQPMHMLKLLFFIMWLKRVHYFLGLWRCICSNKQSRSKDCLIATHTVPFFTYYLIDIRFM